MKERIFYLDVIRVLACLMVICMHAPMPYDGDSNLIRAFVVYSSYWTLPCVCLFFAVSGSLMLPAKVEPSDSGLWLVKRLKKVIVPTVLWSLFYIGVGCVIDGFNVVEFVRSIFSIPFSMQGHGVLWFMYTLIGLYIVTPVISPWLEKCGKKTLQLYLGLWMVTLCYPVLEVFVVVDPAPRGILYYLSGYLGFYVLGYYLRRYGVKGRTICWVALLVCLMPLQLINKLFIEDKIAFGTDLFWYLGPICMLMLVCWWKICTAFSTKLENNTKVVDAVKLVSNLSFGIYLTHIFVMRTCLWKITSLIPNYYIQTLVTILSTLFITIVISYGFSKLPFGDYVIGFRQKYK